MANNTRSGSDEIRAGIAEQIRTNFDHTQVSGLTEDPAVTQNPTRFTSEPYIYIYTVGQNEIDITKDDTPYEYGFNIEVRVRYRSYRGGQRQADEILNQVVDIVRVKTNYIDLNTYGYSIYNITTGDIIYNTFRDRGANYYSVICPVFVKAQFIGITGQLQPVQQAVYSFSGFTFTPSSGNIELYDGGDIIGASSYPSNNNGWDFTTATYAATADSGGTFTGNTLTVGGTDAPLGITATINYQLSTDNTMTTSIEDTDRWTRVRSLRYGAIPPVTQRVPPTITDDEAATYGLRDLSTWTSDRRSIDFRAVEPHNRAINITLNRGEFRYIIIDASHTLISVIDDVFGADVLSDFTRNIVGGYAVYIANRPALRDGETFNYTLNTR